MMVFTKDTVSPMTEAVATTPATALNTNSDQVYGKKKREIQERIDSSARKKIILADFLYITEVLKFLSRLLNVKAAASSLTRP